MVGPRGDCRRRFGARRSTPVFSRGRAPARVSVALLDNENAETEPENTSAADSLGGRGADGPLR